MLYVNGEKVTTTVQANDGKWHHVCVIWSSHQGAWKIYMDGRLAEDGRNLAKGKTIKGTKYTLNCLSIGTPKIIHFLFVSNGKLIFFVVPVFKHFTTVKQFIFVKKKLGAHIRHIRMPTKNFFQSILACTTTPPPPPPKKPPKKHLL